MIIKKPVISEKTTTLMNQGCYAFYVDKRINKKVIKKELEESYSVKVEDIRVVNLPRKPVSFKRIKGIRPYRSKVYIRLKKGQVIPGFEAEKPKDKKDNVKNTSNKTEEAK